MCHQTLIPIHINTISKHLYNRSGIFYSNCVHFSLVIGSVFFSRLSFFCPFLRIDVKLTSDMTFIVALFSVKSNKCFSFHFYRCYFFNSPSLPSAISFFLSFFFDLKSTTIKNEFKMIWHLSHCQLSLTVFSDFIFMLTLLNWSYWLVEVTAGRRNMFRLVFIWYSVRKCNASLVFWVVIVVVVAVAEHRDTCKLAICQFVVCAFSPLFFDSFFFLSVPNNECEDFILYLFSLSTSFYSHKLFLLVGNFTRITFN